LLTKFQSASYRPLYVVDISGNEPTKPELNKEGRGNVFC
jgi:hypothetical protein